MGKIYLKNLNGIEKKEKRYGKDYIPKQRDIVYIDFSETKGHEQKGIRPALVISNDVFNKFTKMAIVCPITSNNEKFPTHYLLENTKKVTGSVLWNILEVLIMKLGS